MKTLVVYYSRSGKTKLAAKALATTLDADIEQITDMENRKGIIGFIKSGYQATKRIKVEISPAKKQPSEYDLVVICTPVWAGTMSSAIRTYLFTYRRKIKNVAYIITKASKIQQYTDVFDEMDRLIGNDRITAISIISTGGSNITQAAQDFAKELVEI